MDGRPSRRSKNIDFTSGPIVKQIIAFTIPAFLGNIFNALYNVVDTIVVGRFVGASALAAVSCSFAITMVCVSVYAGFGMGSGILTAQTFGAKRLDRLNDTVNTAYIGAFIIGTLMIIIGEILAVPLLKLLNTPEDIMKMATQYVRVYFLGSTGQIFYFMGSNMLRGMGDSKWPTYALVFCAILNTLLDLLFVVVFHWDCAGVAAATIISQMISGVAVLIRAYRGSYGIHFDRKTFRLNGSILKQILKIGIPGSLQMLVSSIGTMILTRFANGFGSDVVAANGIVQKVEQFSLMPATSFGTATQMFVGQNLGARNHERTNEGIRKCMAIICIAAAVIGVISFFLAQPLCRIFVKEETVIKLGAEAIHIIAFFYVIHALQLSMSSVLHGAGAMKPVMWFSFAAIAIRIGLCYLLGVLPDRWQGLFWATNGFYIASVIMYAIYMWKGDWRNAIQIERKGPPQGAPVMEDAPDRPEPPQGAPDMFDAPEMPDRPEFPADAPEMPEPPEEA